MAPKAKKPAGKKDSDKETAKPEKKAGKAAKAAEIDEAEETVEAAEGEGQPQVDPDELEEQEDEAEAARASGGGNAAAIAAASGATEMSASFKNFRHHPDMENFYRFIYENDLRVEALTILDEIITEKQARRAQGAKGKSAH